MAKKKEETKKETKEEKSSSWKDLLGGPFLGMMKKGIKESIKVLQDFLNSTQKKIKKEIYSTFFFLGAGFFFFLAFVFLINQYLGLTFGWTFLLIGLLLFIIAQSVKLNSR